MARSPLSTDSTRGDNLVENTETKIENWKDARISTLSHLDEDERQLAWCASLADTAGSELKQNNQTPSTVCTFEVRWLYIPLQSAVCVWSGRRPSVWCVYIFLPRTLNSLENWKAAQCRHSPRCGERGCLRGR